MKAAANIALVVICIFFGRVHALPCTGANVKTFNGPDKHALKYFYFPATAAKGTVVYFEGGPAAFSQHFADEATARHVLHVSPKENLIAMDYRGFGCNSVTVGDFTKDPAQFSSSGFVTDFKTLIRAAGLKSNTFVISGASFGTVVAAKYANSLTKDDPTPVLVNFWSTVAGQYPSDCGQDCYVKRMFAEQFARLPQVQQTFFKEAADSFAKGSFTPYLGYSADTWNATIGSLVEESGIAFARVLGVTYQVAAQNDATAKASALYKVLLQQLAANNPVGNEGPPAPQDQTDPKATLDSTSLDKWVLNTELNFYGENIANTFPRPYLTTKNPEVLYEGDRYVSSLPVVFVQGELDPITPYQLALDMFHGKSAPEKAFAEIKGDSHGLSGWTCGADFFDQALMTKDVNAAIATLQACAVLVK